MSAHLLPTVDVAALRSWIGLLPQQSSAGVRADQHIAATLGAAVPAATAAMLTTGHPYSDLIAAYYTGARRGHNNPAVAAQALCVDVARALRACPLTLKAMTTPVASPVHGHERDTLVTVTRRQLRVLDPHGTVDPVVVTYRVVAALQASLGQLTGTTPVHSGTVRYIRPVRVTRTVDDATVAAASEHSRHPQAA